MPRATYPSVKNAALEILREVEAERMVKTAERQILRNVEQPQTDLGMGLMKLAADLRQVDLDNPEVTYADLHRFMTACNDR